MRFIDHPWTVIKRSATTWTATILGFLVGALANTYLAAFAIIGFIPSPMLQLPLAGLVGAIVIGGPIVLARIVDQPNLTAKIERKSTMTDIVWGVVETPTITQLTEMKRRKLVRDKTPVRLMVKPGSKPAKPDVKTWGDCGFFANVVSIQFPTGDPAYEELNRYLQGLSR